MRVGHASRRRHHGRARAKRGNANPEGNEGVDRAMADPVVIVGAGHNGLSDGVLSRESRDQAARARATRCRSAARRSPRRSRRDSVVRHWRTRSGRCARRSCATCSLAARGVEFVRPEPRSGRPGSGRPRAGVLDDVDAHRDAIRSFSETDAADTRSFCRTLERLGAISLRAARSHAALARRSGSRRTLGSAQDRPAVPRAGPKRRVPSAALDADGRRRSRRRVVLDGSAAGRDRCARHLRRRAGSVVGGNGRGCCC